MMCTLSIVAHEHGFRVVSNRDERRDRAVARHPRVEPVGARRALMPIDPAGGGSWIGVNDAGVVAAVLNRHDGAPLASGPFVSRGEIVRTALGCAGFADALAAVAALDATRFRPFRLLLAQDRRLALVGGNTHELALAESILDRPCLFTASSLGDVFVDTPRRWLFDRLMSEDGDRLRAQARFHRHQWRDQRGISVVMERPDAATVSRTTIDVGRRGIALEYEPLTPARPAERFALPSC